VREGFVPDSGIVRGGSPQEHCGLERSTRLEPELKPPLKWAGGKRWLVPILKELWWPYRHRRLVEPFVGGMAIALGLRPSQALLNDINPHSINFYQWLQRGLIVERALCNQKEVYYCCRAEFNNLVRQGNGNSREAAELFYYLNRTGYNGLCRFNRRNEFNVPFGRYKTIRYTLDFRPYRDCLNAWSIQVGGFEAVPLQMGDFVYADPPYDVEFRQYSAGGFRWEEQVRLAEWLSQHDGPVVASNQATERIADLYQSLGFDVRTLLGPRRISCTGDRTPAMEMLATKNLNREPM
jgi:DNA adenine methylase